MIVCEAGYIDIARMLICEFNVNIELREEVLSGYL